MTRALWLADVLSDAFRGRRGFQVDVILGWEGRGRDGIDPRGVIDHHIGAGSYHALLHYMAHGSSIAPLCNTATCRPQDGVVRITVVAAGKANHAGVAGWPGPDGCLYVLPGRAHTGFVGSKGITGAGRCGEWSPRPCRHAGRVAVRGQADG